MAEPDLAALARGRIESSIETKRLLLAEVPRIAEVAAVLVGVMDKGGKLLFCGNGGSAGDAQHLATELVGRYYEDRPAMAAIALTVDSSLLTAVANDYGYEEVFARQVEGLGAPGDALLGLSTSGNSPNVVRGVQAAKAKGLTTIALTGRSGGALAAEADYCLKVPSDDTPRIQESHILIGHILCEILERSRS